VASLALQAGADSYILSGKATAAGGCAWHGIYEADTPTGKQKIFICIGGGHGYGDPISGAIQRLNNNQLYFTGIAGKLSVRGVPQTFFVSGLTGQNPQKYAYPRPVLLTPN
jgi:hypothetical protein